ncbi:MAG: hypothetical protein E7321_06050 [Clostridiales bacterium]|nr:hypothetical protein [Clostridiales bacterium]
MSRILHDFYKGKLRPEENREWHIEEFRQKRERLSEWEKGFCAGLTEAQKREYIAIIDTYAGLLPCEAEEIYLDGMRMGAQLTMELLAKKDRPILP